MGGKHMSFQLFKKPIPKERKTLFKELSFTEKISYIFEYYKFHFLTVAILTLIIGSFVYFYIQNNYDSVCYIAVVDGKITGYDDRTDAITQGFTQYLGIDGKKQRAEIDYNYSLIVQPMDQEAEVSRSKLYILSSTGSIDGFMANPEYITYFSTDIEPYFMDLTTILSQQELSKIGEENIVYYTKKDGTRIPVAVNLQHTKIKSETNFTMDNPCYGVVVSAKNPENATEFIRYAFSL